MTDNNTRRLVSLISIILAVGMLTMLLTGSAAAQSSTPDVDEDGSAFCETPFIAEALNWILAMFTQAVIGTALVTWVATNFGESIPLVGKSMKKAMKQQRMQSVSSAVQALFIPGLFYVFLVQVGIGVPSCLTLVPYL